MAITGSPTIRSEEVPGATQGRSFAPSIASTARSLFGSAPISRVSNWRPSASVAQTRLAAFTTWALVRTCPSASKITPEPRFWMVRVCCGRGRMSRKKGPNCGLRKMPAKGFGAGTTVSVVMFTTAGPTRSAARTVAVRRRKGSAASTANRGAKSSKTEMTKPATLATTRSRKTLGLRKDWLMLFLDAAGLASTTLRPMDSPAPGFFDSPVPGLSSLDLARRFADRFRNDPRIGARAPGRVNLIGEHTDYSEGLVLPFAIDRETLVLAGPGASSRVRVLACDLAAEGDFEPVFRRRSRTRPRFARGEAAGRLGRLRPGGLCGTRRAGPRIWPSGSRDLEPCPARGRSFEFGGALRGAGDRPRRTRGLWARRARTGPRRTPRRESLRRAFVRHSRPLRECARRARLRPP